MIVQKCDFLCDKNLFTIACNSYPGCWAPITRCDGKTAEPVDLSLEFRYGVGQRWTKSCSFIAHRQFFCF